MRRASEAVASTFARRGTLLPVEMPIGLTEAFAQDVKKQSQWSAFLRRQQLSSDTLALNEVLVFLSDFLCPVMEAARDQNVMVSRWPAGPG